MKEEKLLRGNFKRKRVEVTQTCAENMSNTLQEMETERSD
jgi:hypothetical protein